MYGENQARKSWSPKLQFQAHCTGSSVKQTNQLTKKQTEKQTNQKENKQTTNEINEPTLRPTALAQVSGLPCLPLVFQVSAMHCIRCKTTSELTTTFTFQHCLESHCRTSLPASQLPDLPLWPSLLFALPQFYWSGGGQQVIVIFNC